MFDSEFYNSLEKPKLVPKGNIFKIVWGILYSLMVVSLLIVLFEREDETLWGLALFALQLGLNILWVFTFFKYKKIDLALYVSVLLSLSVLGMIIVFWDISKLAAVLQIPYFLWSSFAVYLNGAIVALNSKN